MISTTTSNARPIHSVSVQSPAKINLSLEILGRRDDEFHEIRSLALGLDFNDTLRLDRADPGVVSLESDHPTLDTGETNLIVRTARLAAESAADSAGVRINLSKRIPLGAGLGGGSGNAASTLAALNRLWDLDRPDSELADWGASLGSDVPLFFSLPSAIVTGRGEQVRPVRLRWSGWVLLVFAGCEVSTRDVYASWSRDDSGYSIEDVATHLLEAETADDLAGLCVNELEPAVFRVSSRVRELAEAVAAYAPRTARVSGAGQTVFIPFDDPDEGEFIMSQLQSEHIGTERVLVRTMVGPLIIE